MLHVQIEGLTGDLEHLKAALEKQNKRVTMFNEMYAELQDAYGKVKAKYEALLSGYAEGSAGRRVDKGSGSDASSEGTYCTWGASRGDGGNSGAV